jgi:exodeoxyribonuclease III
MPDIAAVIRRQRPDVVALQEITDRAAASRLARELELELVVGETRSGYDVAWLSRLSIRRSENHPLPALAKTLLELEVGWDGVRLRLFATHLASSHEKHEHPRRAEVDAILQLLRPLAEQPHALAGDFNALAPDDAVGVPPVGVEPRGEAVAGAPRLVVPAILRAGYVDCYRRLHPVEPGFTYPAHAPWLRLDRVFASSALAPRLVACDVVTGPDAERASDHLPVAAAFR